MRFHIPAVGDDATLRSATGDRIAKVSKVFTLPSNKHAFILEVIDDCGDTHCFRLYSGPEHAPWNRVTETASGRWIPDRRKEMRQKPRLVKPEAST